MRSSTSPGGSRWSPAPAAGSGARDQWHRLVDTNLGAAFRVGPEVARRMRPRGRGEIVNVCSVQSEAARPGTAVYVNGQILTVDGGMLAVL